MEIVSLQNLSQQTNIQHSLLSEDTSCGEEQEGKTPQQHHDAHEKRTSRKRNALPGVICFQSGISHFFFKFKAWRQSYFTVPCPVSYGRFLHEEGGAKHSTRRIHGCIFCMGREIWELG
jgi:hypothetical protein